MSASITPDAWRIVHDAVQNVAMPSDVRMAILQQLYAGLSVDPAPAPSPATAETVRDETAKAFVPLAAGIAGAVSTSLRKFDKRVARLTIALEKIAAATTRESSH